MSQASLKRAVREHEGEFEHDVQLDDPENPTEARCRLCSFSYSADGNRDDTPTNPDIAAPAAVVDPIDPPEVPETVPTGQTQPGPTAAARKR